MTDAASDPARDGVLSSRAEIHATAVGALLGASIGLGWADLAAPALGLVLGDKAIRKRLGHLRDARAEMAYTAAGVVVAAVATAAVVRLA